MLEAIGQTDVGRRRKLNEDSFLVDPETNLYSVCDGMGGHNAGEVASKMAIEALESFIQKSHREKEITWPYGLDVNLSFDGNRLKTAVKLANKKVFRAADNRVDLYLDAALHFAWVRRSWPLSCPGTSRRSVRQATAVATSSEAERLPRSPRMTAGSPRPGPKAS